MARLASEAKGGFYPTPPEEMAHILKFLHVDQGAELTFLDPCAGEGKALKQMADHFNGMASIQTYGIELEKNRAQLAESALDNVLNCSYDEVRMSHNSISMMYLNPPFSEVQGKRMELAFLDELSKDYLDEGSLLIFNIPQYVLRDVATVLSARFTNISVYRFTDENNNYQRFKQVIVFGVRRRRGMMTIDEREYSEAMERQLKLYGYGQPLKTLADAVEAHGMYRLKQASKPVQLFSSMRVNPTKIVESSDKSGHFDKVLAQISELEITSTQRNIRPALPLKTTHIASAISSGALPESMGSHLLVGVTKRVQEKQVVYDTKSDKEVETTIFKPKSIVRVFSEQGIFSLK